MTFVADRVAKRLLRLAAAEGDFGPYRLVEPIGRGGMGLVYRAEHVETGEAVALKTVPAPRQALLQGIRREIRALARLAHPGIVRVLAEGVADGMPWYAMELVEGPTLAAWNASRAARLEETLSLVHGITTPLAYLHGAGLVHRDLKPENVVLRDGREPVLVDLGLSWQVKGDVARDELQPGALAGTAPYMAPELWRGEAADARADIYALGCILYGLLTGRLPFVAVTGTSLRSSHLDLAPLAPSTLDPSIPGALDALILSMLAKAPRDRIGRAADVAAALERHGARSPASGPVPPARPYLYRPRMHGRGGELSALELRLSRLEGGRGALLLIEGESGIGKTRLLMELSVLAERKRHLVLAASCGEGAEAPAAPLAAFAPLLRALVDRLRELEAGERESLLGASAALLLPFAPELEALVPTASATLAELPPAAARLRLFEALELAMSRLAGSRPVVLLLDDLQGIDELSLGFLEHLRRRSRCDETPVLLVGALRAEEAPAELQALARARGIAVLRLRRLDAGSVSEVVEDMLAAGSVPEGFAAEIASHSEGNPLFVAEYLEAAVDGGLLEQRPGGGWQARDLSRLPTLASLPDAVRGLVDRRLARLSPAARDLAEAAAILGRDLSGEILQASAGSTEEDLLDALTELLTRQIVEELEPGTFRFVHDKVRLRCEEAIPEDRRRERHARAARALEEAAPGSLGREPGALGQHWERAGLPQRAAPHYLEAARRAARSFALKEAERLYRAFLACAPAGAAVVAARNELGESVLAVTGRIADAEAEHRLAEREARELQDGAGRRRALRRLALLHRITGRMGQARLLLEEAMTTIASASKSEEAQMLVEMAGFHRLEGRLGPCRELLERAAALFEGSGERRRAAAALADLASVARAQGRAADSDALQGRALEVARAEGDRRLEAIVLTNVADGLRSQDRPQEARALLEQALVAVREVGDRHTEAMVLGGLASLEGSLSRAERAVDLYEAAGALARQVGDRRLHGRICSELGTLHAMRGDAGAARAALEQAVEIHREGGDDRSEAVALVGLASFERRAGSETAVGRALLDRAVALLEPLAARDDLALCLCERGQLEHASGGDAAGWLARARAMGASEAAAVAAMRELARTLEDVPSD